MMFTCEPTNLIPIVRKSADFVYCYQNNKKIDESDKEACKQFLDYLNTSFDESKAAEALKSIIYTRLKTDRANLSKGDKGKTYRNMVNYFEKKVDSKGEPCKFSFPSRDSLIQICLDFGINDKNQINWLFDKMYYDRLYLKESRDFVVYCCLTKPKLKDDLMVLYPDKKNVLDCINAFITDENIDLEHRHLKKGFDNASKYTSEIYDDIENEIESLDDIKTYYHENMPIFSQQRQYTVKNYLLKMAKNIDDEGLLTIIFFSDFDDSDDNRSSLYKKIWASFSTYCKGGKGGKDDKITYLWSEIGDDAKESAKEDSKDGNPPIWLPFKSDYNEFSTRTIKALESIDYLIPRGTFLLMYLYVLAVEKEEMGLENVDWITKLNVKLDSSGFALLNDDGILIDKIVSLYINTFGFYAETIEDLLHFISFISRLDTDCPFDD